MTNDKHMILLTKINKLIGFRKIKFTFFRLNFFTLHTVFGYHRVKLVFDNPESS